MKKKFNQITDEEKRRYVDLYQTGEYSLREVAKKGGISHNTLYKWVVNVIPDKRKSRYIIVKDKSKPQAVDSRDAEIARLKASLEKAELRAHALDTMIDETEVNHCEINFILTIFESIFFRNGHRHSLKPDQITSK